MGSKKKRAPKLIEARKYIENKGRKSEAIKWQVNIPATETRPRERKCFDTEDAAVLYADSINRLLRREGEAGLEKTGCTASQALTTFFATRSLEGRHGDTARHLLNDFERVFGSELLDNITAIDLAAYWNAERPRRTDGKRRFWAESSKASSFRYLQMFWNWCLKNQKCTSNPLALAERPKVTRSAPKVLGVEQVKALLENASTGVHRAEYGEYMRAYICLSFFAGLRTSECLGMTIDRLDWEEGDIHVPKGKTGERFVTMTEAFKRNMRGISAWKWPLWRNFYKARRELVKRAGIGEWPRNAARKTFISAYLAVTKNAPELAHQVGHNRDVEMINRVYARRIKTSEAVRLTEL